MENKDYEIKQCLCCWYDLLGYGSPMITVIPPTTFCQNEQPLITPWNSK